MTKSIFLACFVITLIITGCTENKIYYKIPLLIGKNIDEVRRTLKSIEDKEHPFRKSFSYDQDYYSIDGRILLVNFDPTTKEVTQISLVYPQGYSDKNDILKAGNLQEKTNHYTCEFSTDDWSISPFTSYNSIRVIPTH